jgi:hypothetical protein
LTSYRGPAHLARHHQRRLVDLAHVGDVGHEPIDRVFSLGLLGLERLGNVVPSTRRDSDADGSTIRFLVRATGSGFGVDLSNWQ